MSLDIEVKQNLKKILQVLKDIKALKIKVLDIIDRGSIADYLIITEGTSSRHVHSIVSNVNKKLKKKVISIEGLTQADWAIVDFGDIVLHVFKPEIREHYNLEKIWSSSAPNEKKFG
tara:strand:- start:125 stop:475 length:351 start_codon:yes stop_codon:yes gene_type:complete